MSRLFAWIGLRSSVVVLSAALMVLVLAVAIVPRSSVAADDHPMQIKGYVYDNAGHKVANADVTVTIYSGATPGAFGTDTSDSVGYFTVDFAKGQWATGDKVLITAEYKSLQASNGTDATPVVILNGNNFFAWKNVTFPYEISQLGNMTGLLVTAGLVGVVAAVAVVWRRKAKSSA